MQFMFSTVYRVTQKEFYARPYIQCGQRCCHISGWEFSWTLCRKRRSYYLAPWISGFDTIRLFLHGRLLRTLCTGEKFEIGWFETTYHWSSWAYNSSRADKHVARAWISFRYLSSYNRCSHWSVRTCINILLK